jgi:hypothetical protein
MNSTFGLIYGIDAYRSYLEVLASFIKEILLTIEYGLNKLVLAIIVLDGQFFHLSLLVVSISCLEQISNIGRLLTFACHRQIPMPKLQSGLLKCS